MLSGEDLVRKAELISAIRDYESRRVRRKEGWVDFTVSTSGSDDKILIRVITGASSGAGYVGVDTVKEMSTVLSRQAASPGVPANQVADESLQIVQDAVRELRAALEKDPGNQTLQDLLLKTYQREIRLMRRMCEIAPQVGSSSGSSQG